MSLSTIEYLRHILDELLFLSEQSHGLQKDEFINDAVLKRAFIRSLEIIGEATKQLPLTLRAKYSAVSGRLSQVCAIN